jgi:hypothetical protein
MVELAEEDFGEAMHAWQKLLHASFAALGKSFHLKAKSGSYEVSYSSRVYRIDLQKGMGQDKKTKTWTRVCFPQKKSSYVGSASLRNEKWARIAARQPSAPASPKKGRLHEKSYQCNDQEHPIPVARDAQDTNKDQCP